MQRRRKPGTARAWTAAVAAGLLAGCSGAAGRDGSSAGGAAGVPSAAVAVASDPPSPAPCPSAGRHPTPWPPGPLAQLPRIPGAVLGGTTHVQDITYQSLTTARSLHEETRLLLRALATGGFLIGRGDAEATEADVPFTSVTLLGSVRLTEVAACRTAWVMAVRPRMAAAAVPPYGSPSAVAPGLPSPPAAASSALPFG